MLSKFIYSGHHVPLFGLPRRPGCCWGMGILKLCTELLVRGPTVPLLYTAALSAVYAGLAAQAVRIPVLVPGPVLHLVAKLRQPA